jgi:hypothetical protein
MPDVPEARRSSARRGATPYLRIGLVAGVCAALAFVCVDHVLAVMLGHPPEGGAAPWLVSVSQSMALLIPAAVLGSVVVAWLAGMAEGRSRPAMKLRQVV